MPKEKARTSPIEDAVPEIVKKGMEKTLKDSSLPGIPKGARIVRIALSSPEFSLLPFTEAYAFTFNGDVPDAYFDERWELIVSVSGLVAFDSQNDGSRTIAKASMKMAGISEKKIDAKNVWFRIERDGSETALDPFGAEGFELWNEVRFFENRIDFLRRLSAMKAEGGKRKPMETGSIAEYVASGAVTIAEFSEMRTLGGISDSDYARFSKSLSAALPAQISDPRFDRPYRFSMPDGKQVSTTPVKHGLSESKIAELLARWVLSKEQASSATKALAAKEAFLSSFRETVRKSSAELQNLKRETVPRK